jgi:hypothetical protein
LKAMIIPAALACADPRQLKDCTPSSVTPKE